MFGPRSNDSSAGLAIASFSKELKHPAQVQAGGKLELSMKWQNVGSAPCYRPYRVAFAWTMERIDEP